MAQSKPTKAVFRGNSSHLGPQQGEAYTIRVVRPGQIYPFQVLIEELPGCSDEYLDADAVRKEWDWAQKEGQ